MTTNELCYVSSSDDEGYNDVFERLRYPEVHLKDCDVFRWCTDELRNIVGGARCINGEILDFHNAGRVRPPLAACYCAESIIPIADGRRARLRRNGYQDGYNAEDMRFLWTRGDKTGDLAENLDGSSLTSGDGVIRKRSRRDAIRQTPHDDGLSRIKNKQNRRIKGAILTDVPSSAIFPDTGDKSWMGVIQNDKNTQENELSNVLKYKNEIREKEKENNRKRQMAIIDEETESYDNDKLIKKSAEMMLKAWVNPKAAAIELGKDAMNVFTKGIVDKIKDKAKEKISTLTNKELLNVLTKEINDTTPEEMVEAIATAVNKMGDKVFDGEGDYKEWFDYIIKNPKVAKKALGWLGKIRVELMDDKKKRSELQKVQDKNKASTSNKEDEFIVGDDGKLIDISGKTFMNTLGNKALDTYDWAVDKAAWLEDSLSDWITNYVGEPEIVGESEIHVGDHSVDGKGAIKFVPEEETDDVKQTIFTYMLTQQNTTDASTEYDGSNRTWDTKSTWINRNFDGSMISMQATSEAKKGKAAGTGSQKYTPAVSFGAAEVIDRLNVGAAGDYMNGSSVNAREVGAGLPTHSNISRDVSAELGGGFLDSLDRVDNAAYYAVGWAYWLWLRDLEQAGDGWIWNAIPQDSIRAQIITSDTGTASEIANAILNDIAQGKFAYLRKTVTDKQIAVLTLMASGLGMLDVATGSTRLWGFSGITSPNIPTVVYYTKWESITIPTSIPTDLTSTDIFNAIIAIASLRGEQTMAMNGLMKATCLWHGSMYEINYSSNNTGLLFMNATGECLTQTWPKPRDWNFLWRALDINSNYPQDASFELDWRSVTSYNQSDVCRACAKVGVWIATATGIVNQYFNFRWQEWIQLYMETPDMPQTLELMRFLFQSDNTNGYLSIWRRLVSGVSRQLGKFTVNPRNFVAGDWNSGEKFTAEMLFGTAELWDDAIFYPMEVYDSSAYMLESLPLSWGRINEVKFDVHNEMSTPFNGTGSWYADMGDAQYKDLATSAVPYTYIDYGVCALNAIYGLDGRIMTAVPTARWWETQNFGNSAIPTINGSGPWDKFAWNSIGLLKFWTLWTYDWEDRRVIAPVLPKSALAAATWTQMQINGQQTALNFGVTWSLQPTFILPTFSGTSVPVHLQNSSVRRMAYGLVGLQADQPHSKRARVEGASSTGGSGNENGTL